MESMGKLIAKMRKEHGWTQQELADRLHVSNKAVSRWEHDVCAPDIYLLSTIAEIFEISTDELLAGEKYEEIKETSHSICDICTRIKVSTAISMALVIMALVTMFAMVIADSIVSREIEHRPEYILAGIIVALILDVIAFIITALGSNNIKKSLSSTYSTNDNICRGVTLYSLDTWLALIAEVASLVIVVYLVVIRSGVMSRATIDTHSLVMVCIVIAFLFVYLKTVFYMVDYSRKKLLGSISSYTEFKLDFLSLLTLLLLLLASVIITFAPFTIDIEHRDTTPITIAMYIFGYLMVAVALGLSVYAICKKKNMTYHVRNIVLTIPVIASYSIYKVEYIHPHPYETIAKIHLYGYNWQYILLSIAVIFLVTEMIIFINKCKSLNR